MTAQEPQKQEPQESQEEIKCHICRNGFHEVCPARLPETEALPATDCCCGATKQK
jgi:hypothetical protein